jgi:thioredoxin 2
MTGEVVRCGHCGQANRVPAAAAGTPRCGKCHQALPWIADADDTTFGEVADAARIPVIVDLWAPWCGPCRMVSPALEQLARDLAGKVKLVKVNVDTSPQLSQRFGAQAIPTLLVLRRGQVIARQTGAVPLAALRTWADNALAALAEHRSRISTRVSGRCRGRLCPPTGPNDPWRRSDPNTFFRSSNLCAWRSDCSRPRRRADVRVLALSTGNHQFGVTVPASARRTSPGQAW